MPAHASVLIFTRMDRSLVTFLEGKTAQRNGLSLREKIENSSLIHRGNVIYYRLIAFRSVHIDRSDRQSLRNGYLLLFKRGTSLAVISRWYSLPLFSQGHHSTRIQDAVSEKMIEFEPNAVHGPMKSVLRVEQRISFRS